MTNTTTMRVWARNFHADRGINRLTIVTTLEGIGFKVEVLGFARPFDQQAPFAQVRSSHFRTGKWEEVLPWRNTDSTGLEDSLQAIAEEALTDTRDFLRATAATPGDRL